MSNRYISTEQLFLPFEAFIEKFGDSIPHFFIRFSQLVTDRHANTQIIFLNIENEKTQIINW